jgi:hypothetical protein
MGRVVNGTEEFWPISNTTQMYDGNDISNHVPGIWKADILDAECQKSNSSVGLVHQSTVITVVNNLELSPSILERQSIF